MDVKMVIKEYNIVLGDGSAVWNKDKSVRLVIDHSKPITLQRCKQIYEVACQLAGRQFKKISILHTIMETPEDIEAEIPVIYHRDKRWDYYPDKNALFIYDKGELVYANENGRICSDPVALCETADLVGPLD